MKGLGILQRSVLWHLLEEGTATAAELHGLIGDDCIEQSRSRALRLLTLLQLVQVTECPRERRSPVWKGRVPWLYGLTPTGIQAALLLDRAEVRIANPPQEETAS